MSDNQVELIVSNLLDIGLAPDTVSAITGVTVREVKTLRKIKREYSDIELENVELSNTLTHKVLTRAIATLDLGHPDEQASVIRAVLSTAMKQYAAEDNSAQEETKLAIERIFTQQREIIPYAVEPRPIASGIDDPDEEIGIEEA